MTEIRSNQQLEGDLNLMDIKIGLLVKNRITLEVSGFADHFSKNKQEWFKFQMIVNIVLLNHDTLADTFNRNTGLKVTRTHN